jgi:AcrR family transcriptional regulator
MRPFFVAPDDPPAKHRIMVAALELFTRHGIAVTSIRDIAARAGYTNPALYKHFRSKEELAEHLLISCHQRLLSDLDAAARRGRGLENSLRALTNSFCTSYEEYPAAVIYVSDNVQAMWDRVEGRIGSRTFMSVFGGLLAEGVDTRTVAYDLDLEAAGAAMVGVLQQFGRLWYLGLLPTPATDHVDTLTRILTGIAMA